MPDPNPNFIVPVGTQIVTEVAIKATNGDVLFAKGVVGIVIKAPVDSTHAYRVRFMDGTEMSLNRREFTINRLFQNPLAPDNWLSDFDLKQCVIYQCVVGSRAYGLDEEGSDVDQRGIYLPPAELHWSLYGVPEQLEDEEKQQCYWELQKFLTLALKGNPNILECLYTPLVESATPLAEELLAMRSIFLSKLIYQTYNGYVMSQFHKLEHHLKNYGTIKWKHAMHLIRLLLSGIIALDEGYIPVRVEAYRDRLLSIRREEHSWAEVNKWRKQLHQQFDAAYEKTALPNRPDYERANQFLIYARRSVVK
ncbi:MAG: nucleotidyltransferase domain-containing protein [Anaerolineae bacterium]|nr:MAG: nucleotidyltransferase domain-containing protein [Anaerolineae bacterium]